MKSPLQHLAYALLAAGFARNGAHRLAAVVGGLMLAPLAWWLDAPLPSLSAVQWLAYAYLCLAGALLAYALWFAAGLVAVRVSVLAVQWMAASYR